MRKKIVAGNWKMNCDLSETEVLLTSLKERFPRETNTVVMVAPAFTNLYHAFQSLKETGIHVVAQNMHQQDQGAFTGEISAKMLKSIGVETVILGHSERRAIFHETDALLSEKVNNALKHEMKIIFCIGEELSDRRNNTHFDLIEKQLKKGLFQVEEAAWSNIVVAYEPVWAIGTGETASPDQVQEMHGFIRKTIAKEYDETLAEKVSILYGGSVKPANAKEIFDQKDVDGGLIGGAALTAQDFIAIVQATG